jgi:hypothetical protein
VFDVGVGVALDDFFDVEAGGAEVGGDFFGAEEVKID